MIGFHGSTMMYAEHLITDEIYVYDGLKDKYRPKKGAREVSYSVLSFHVNRMLHEQAEKLVNLAVDAIVMDDP